MAWKNGYYYRQHWRNNTCVSEFVGAGLIADLAADLDRIERGRKELARLELKAEIEEQAGIDRQIDDVCRQVGAITQAAMVATGHYKHKGQWRKRRMSELTKEQRQDLADTLKRLQVGKGTKEDEKKFLGLLKEAPDTWTVYGDLPRNAVSSTIEGVAGKEKAGFPLRVSLEAGIEQLKTQYGYNEASPLEKMLIEQVVLCWLRLYWVETLFSQQIKSFTSKQVENWEKRLSANQRRFLRACETLARVRRLASRNSRRSFR